MNQVTQRTVPGRAGDRAVRSGGWRGGGWLRGVPLLDRPIILLGAARSGTKALREAIASHPEIVAVPHDINYVWKFGHYEVPHDELYPDQLTPEIVRYIRRRLTSYQRRGGGSRLVEKTVSNTLRVAYVRAVLPEACFIHLLRDGRDVAASARRMWQAPLDWRRLWRKAGSFPLGAVPRYGAAYARSHLRRAFRHDRAVRSWGPRFAGIDEAAAGCPLLTVCGLQWRRCVESALAALADVPGSVQLTVRYEELVREPAGQMVRIFRFLGLAPADQALEHARRSITAVHLDKWRKEVAPPEAADLLRAIGPTLERLGYSVGAERPSCRLASL